MKTLYLLALQPATIGPNATLHWCHRAFCGGPNTFTFGQRDRASSVGIRRRLDFLGHHSCALGATACSTCGDFEEAHRNNALNRFLYTLRRWAASASMSMAGMKETVAAQGLVGRRRSRVPPRWAQKKPGGLASPVPPQTMQNFKEPYALDMRR